MKLKVGKTYQVKVLRILSFGAVVEMSDKSTQLIHISNISERFVRNIEDFVKEGDVINADCIVGKAHDEELSIKEYTKDIILPYHLKDKKHPVKQ